MSFHSTDCPSEWGHDTGSMSRSSFASFHSTDCPSEWGLLLLEIFLVKLVFMIQSFHSTDCPSEWGPSYAFEELIAEMGSFPFN